MSKIKMKKVRVKFTSGNLQGLEIDRMIDLSYATVGRQVKGLLNTSDYEIIRVY